MSSVAIEVLRDQLKMEHSLERQSREHATNMGNRAAIEHELADNHRAAAEDIMRAIDALSYNPEGSE